jgi:hypothetical protein
VTERRHPYTTPAAEALRAAGHTVEQDEHHLLKVHLDTGYGHRVVAMPTKTGHWDISVQRHPDDPRGEPDAWSSHEGIPLRAPRADDDAWPPPEGLNRQSMYVAAKPAELPARVREFMRHPDVVRALNNDVIHARTSGVRIPDADHGSSGMQVPRGWT